MLPILGMLKAITVKLKSRKNIPADIMSTRVTQQLRFEPNHPKSTPNIIGSTLINVIISDL
jgi:hypothetical protein